MYQGHHSHRRLRAKKKSQAIDLTNAAVKQKSALVARKSLVERTGDLALLYRRDVELLDPPVYRTQRTRRNSAPIKGTEFQKPGAGGARPFLRHRCRHLGRYP